MNHLKGKYNPGEKEAKADGSDLNLKGICNMAVDVFLV